MDVLKRVNALHVARWAKAEGVARVAALDPDELLLIDGRRPASNVATAAVFDSLHASVDRAFVTPLEAIPPLLDSGEPFIDCGLFLPRRPALQLVQRVISATLRRARLPPPWPAWFEFLHYRLFLGSTLARRFRYPDYRRPILADYLLGYTNRKSIVRTSANATK